MTRSIPGRFFQRGGRRGFRTQLEAMQSSKRVWICIACGRWYETGKAKKHKPVCDGDGHGGCGAKDFAHFPSTGEATRYMQLRMMERAGVIRDLKLRTPFPLIVRTPQGGEVQIGKWECDFDYERRDGERVVEDFKGGLSDEAHTRLFELKRKHVEAQYGIRIRIVTTDGRRTDDGRPGTAAAG